MKPRVRWRGRRRELSFLSPKPSSARSAARAPRAASLDHSIPRHGTHLDRLAAAMRACSSSVAGTALFWDGEGEEEGRRASSSTEGEEEEGAGAASSRTAVAPPAPPASSAVARKGRVTARRTGSTGRGAAARVPARAARAAIDGSVCSPSLSLSFFCSSTRPLLAAAFRNCRGKSRRAGAPGRGPFRCGGDEDSGVAFQLWGRA